jgi:chromosome segregation ATPase
MNREELKEKICEISNSEFPLIDFFNDIDWLDDRHFNTEKAYEDIEKIYNVFMFYINKCNKLEKELKQTKLNFRNSQTHSKNCYKKLKEKYTRLERAYKNNEVMTRDLNELINRNLELKKDYDLLDEDYDQLFAKFLERKNENEKLKQAIKVLKEKIKYYVGDNKQ